MKKNLYSLMLSEEVVREIDRRAHQLGTNRSNLINQILAESVSLTTPERRVNDIFSAIEELVAPSDELIPFISPNAFTMSLKSCLEYKYRPTVKYEVELFRGGEGALGELSVIFRTQSAGLINAMTDFFRLWKQIEDGSLAPRLKAPTDYALYDGRFVRSIAAPAERNCTAEEMAGAIADYIKLFDRLMKGYAGGSCGSNEIEREYRADLDGRGVLI